ncbi:GNAT family N-acetyltransferase [Lysinibacillus sp. SGAir0095]|uniref:GNAT family N-acetyltransferase n=1 Tax=Lysinibacillus sp. SGAir0095 TaxID=2070463 RepID=UPI001F0D5A56|nr:GNAT family N-acetyltransferase [Lysinibacillus sp. SGAir0095]
MSYKYRVFNSMPESNILKEILKLHKIVFGSTGDLVYKMSSKPQLLIITAMDGEKVIGYKIGYAINEDKFYSWLGGVDNNYRKQGIASKLMEKQHQLLRNKGYSVVQTKSMNKWRSMLILNIKSGFDIVETYKDEKELHKIILEKYL